MEVRRAKLADLAWIRRLAQELAPQQCSPWRECSPEQARQAVRERLLPLEAARMAPGVRILTAWSATGPCGFCILGLDQVEDATGQLQAEVLEMAALTSEALQALCREAAIQAHRHGREYLTWKVPAWDPEALERAQAAGFAVERCEILMQCPRRTPKSSPE